MVPSTRTDAPARAAVSASNLICLRVDTVCPETLSGVAGTSLTSNTLASRPAFAAVTSNLRSEPTRPRVLSVPFKLASMSPSFALKSSCRCAPTSLIRVSIRIGPVAMAGSSSVFSKLPISVCSILSVRSALTRLSDLRVPLVTTVKSPAFALKSSCVRSPASFNRASICAGPVTTTGTSSFSSMPPNSGCSILSVRSAPSSGSRLPSDTMDVQRQFAQHPLHGHAHITRGQQ